MPAGMIIKSPLTTSMRIQESLGLEEIYLIRFMQKKLWEMFYGLLSHIKITRTLNDKTNLFVGMQMLQKRIFDLGWVIFEGGDGEGFGLAYLCEEVFQLVLVVG